MTTQVIISFIVFNVLNVIIQTVKSIATIKCGKAVASIVNAVAYGLYTYIVVLMAADGINLWFKIAVIAGANLIGVYVVKLVEEKARKDKLWRVEMTIPKEYTDEIHTALKIIPHSYIENVGNHTIFNFYCATQKDSQMVKMIADKYNAKYFVSESKNL